MTRKKLLAIGMVLLVSATVFAGTAAAADDVEKQEGVTTAQPDFGPGVPAGWDYAKVASPSGDSWVAVLWGKGPTVLTKGDVWVVGMWTRYLGAAKIYDQNGALLSRSKPVAVKGYFMQRFSAIYEFNDTNGDGIANVVRSNSPVAADQVIAHEPVYKAASLRAAWVKTGATAEVVDGKRVWNLTLTATDLPYIVLGNASGVNQSVGDWKLNSVSFTFHLWGWRETTSVSVPLFNITVDKLATPPNVTTTPAGTKDFTANLTHVKAKEDHSITGWDFDPSNSRAGLVLETNLAYGYFMWSRAPAWMAALWIEKYIKGAGKVSYTAEGAQAATDIDGGDATLPDADGAAGGNDTVRKVGGDRRIQFSGNWQREGLFLWSSDTQVWATETASPTTGTVNFQLQGARRFAWNLGPAGGLKCIGVYLMGGFSYAGGPYYKVEHDPETDVDMGDVQIPDVDNSPPVARITVGKTEFSYRESVVLNASASTDPDNDALTYFWDFDDGSPIISREANRTLSVGVHRVNLTVDDGGSKNTTSVTITVVNKDPSARIAGPKKKTVLTTESVRLDATGSSDPENDTLTYKWTEGSRVLGSGRTLEKKFAKGDHTVTLTVTDALGGTSSATASFKVEEKKSPGFEALFLFIGIGAAALLVGRRKQ